MFLVLVLLDGVRSAEPPTVADHLSLTISSTASDALRVATAGFSALVFFLSAISAGARSAGTAHAIAASKFSAFFDAFLLFSQASRLGLPLAPMARQSAMMSSGITKGGDGQSRTLRAPAISSAPGASLCAFCVPWRLGMPKPMNVWQANSTGLSLPCAQSSAPATSATSWPLHAIVFQPAAWKRSIVSVLSESDVAPSMVMELLSKRTIRRL